MTNYTKLNHYFFSDGRNKWLHDGGDVAGLHPHPVQNCKLHPIATFYVTSLNVNLVLNTLYTYVHIQCFFLKEEAPAPQLRPQLAPQPPPQPAPPQLPPAEEGDEEGYLGDDEGDD